MREFFSGWKRKLGIITLLTACVCTIAWMRSVRQMEVIHFCPGRSLFIAVSRNQAICIGRFRYPTHEIALSKSIAIFNSSLKQFNIGFSTEQSSRETNFEYWIGTSDHPTVSRWHWAYGLFILGTESHTALLDEHERAFVVVPWSSVVIPLTALSACLLVSIRKKPLAQAPTT